MRASAALIAVTAGCAAAWPSQAAATTLAPAYEERVLAVGFDTPTAFAWTPDGRLLVAEKAGVVKLVDDKSAPFARVILDISGRVSSGGDRGLLGIEVDSAFGRNRYVYVSYTFEDDRTRPAAPKTARLSRFTLSRHGTIVGGARSEKVLIGQVADAPCPSPGNAIDCIPTDGESHTVGAIRADPDGTLWLATGDGSDWARPNRPALRTFDERSFAGKLLHVDRRGHGLPGHPFCRSKQHLDLVCTKVFAKGFRNPFRFSLAPPGNPVVGDVGWESREEIDVVKPGGNYGWPCYEGRIRTPGYDAFRRCRTLYAREGKSGGALPPDLDYRRAAYGGTVVAGPVYPATAAVAPFRSAFFFGDFVTGQLFRLSGGIGAMDQQTELFGTGWHGVDLRPGPDGELTYVNVKAGIVAGAYHVPGNKTPTGWPNAEPASGPLPLQVELSAVGAQDPEGGDLQYSWRLGDGARASGPVVRHTYREAKNYVVRLTITDPEGASVIGATRVFAGNTPPTARIVRPRGDVRRFVAGNAVRLSAVARDAEEGTLSGRGLRWSVILHHGSHEHYVANARGRTFTFRPQPDHDVDSSYTIMVTATDGRGLDQQSPADTVTLRPKGTTIALRSVPPGAPIAYGGRRLVAPTTVRTAIGYRASLVAARSFEVEGIAYRFSRWRDSERRRRTLTIPAQPSRLTAIYARAR